MLTNLSSFKFSTKVCERDMLVNTSILEAYLILGFLWTLGMAGLAFWLEVDYEWRGILIIVFFYLFNGFGHSFPYSRGGQFFAH